MTVFRITAALLLLGTMATARAEQRGVFPADIPDSYRSECGDCHLMYAPDLLPADAWRSIMGDLTHHFGVDARIDEDQREEIKDFLVGNAGRALRPMKNGDPRRLTETLWFHRMHGKVKALFQNPKVMRKSNCLACHADADEGRYKTYTPMARNFMKKNYGP